MHHNSILGSSTMKHSPGENTNTADYVDDKPRASLVNAT